MGRLWLQGMEGCTRSKGVAENIMGEGDQHWEVGLEDYMGSMLSIRS